VLPSREDLARATRSLGRRADIDLLLRTIQGPDEEASRAFSTYSERYPLADIDIKAFMLMPRVAARLVTLAPKAPELGRILGIRRYLWLRTEATVHLAEETIDLLERFHVRATPIKGLSLRRLLPVPPKGDLRPMLDADLLVTLEEYGPAIGILTRHGYRMTAAHEHATAFEKHGHAIDLHHRVMRRDPYYECRLDAEGKLTPTSAFIIACMHGISGSPLWVFDAEALAPFVDYDEVTAYALSRALVLTFAAALKRLRATPPEVTRRLDRAPASHLEALEMRHVTDEKDRAGTRASALLLRLRKENALVTAEGLKRYERMPGMNWDARWTKEWPGPSEGENG